VGADHGPGLSAGGHRFSALRQAEAPGAETYGWWNQPSGGGATIAGDAGIFDHLKTIADSLQAFVTTAGVVVAGIFAYYKFLKDRVYRPHIDISVTGGRVKFDANHFLLAEVVVRNLAGTKMKIEQEGTALIISTDRPGASDFVVTRWDRRSVVAILKQHAWIEVGETITDSVMVRVPESRNGAYRLDVRVVIAHRKTNIEVASRSIVPASVDWVAANGR
jgi:hypothetical protein